MKVYLIDFENVKSKGLTGVENLSENDRVIIFYSENSDTISFEMHCRVISSSAQIEYLKVRVGGKNALDFQLSTLLGYLVAKEMYSHIFIISGDKGFDKLHDFWNCTPGRECSSIVYRNVTLAAAAAFANSPVCKKLEADLANGLSIKASAMEETSAEPEKADENKPAETEISHEVVSEPAAEPVTEAAEETVQAPHDRESKPKAKRENAVQPEIEGKTLPIEILNEEHEIAWEMPADREESFTDPGKVKITKVPAPKGSKKANSLDTRLIDLLQGDFLIESGDLEIVRGCISGAESKADFHNELMKTFKETGAEIYKILRNEFPQLKELLDREGAESEDAPAEAIPAAAAEAVSEAAAEAEVIEKPKPEKKKKRSAKKKASPIHEEVGRLLRDICSDEEINTVTELVKSTNTKQQLYLSVVKAYKKERGCEIYKLLKPAYSGLEKLRNPQEV